MRPVRALTWANGRGADPSGLADFTVTPRCYPLDLVHLWCARTPLPSDTAMGLLSTDVTGWAITPPRLAAFGHPGLFLHLLIGAAMPPQAINDKLTENNGITAFNMKWIKREFDSTWERLSESRCRELQEWLQSEDIGYLCPGAHDGHDRRACPLPSVETAEVLLYQKKSAIGVIIRLTSFDTPLSYRPGAVGGMLSMMAGILESSLKGVFENGRDILGEGPSE